MRSHTHTYRHLHAHMRTRSQTRPRTHTYTNTHARASTHSDGCAANGMNGRACASLSGSGASCAQADTQTLQTIEDQIRRRGASSAAAARACHVCARARVSVGVFVSALLAVFVVFILFQCLSRYVFACLRFACLCLERSFGNLVGLFECSEFDVIVYSELYRSNGHHQPWLWQVQPRIQRACDAPATRLRNAHSCLAARPTGDRRRRL